MLRLWHFFLCENKEDFYYLITYRIIFFQRTLSPILKNSGDYFAHGISGVTDGLYNGTSVTLTGGGVVLWNIEDFTNCSINVTSNVYVSTDGETFSTISLSGFTNDITSYKYMHTAVGVSTTFTMS